MTSECSPDEIRERNRISDTRVALRSHAGYLLQGGKTDVFNLGNGKGFSVLEVINAAQRVAGQHINYSVQARRPGDPAVLVASATKAKGTLGWTPKYTDLGEIIKTAWRWHRTKHA